MSITIAAETINGFWHWGGTTAKLRIFSTDGGGEWRSASGVAVPVGQPGGRFYKDVPITISGTDITIDSCTLEPTEGFIAGYDPTYTIYYYNAAGTKNYGCKTTEPNIRIGQTPSSTTWAAIEILNNRGVSTLNQTAYTKAESDYRFASVLALVAGYLPKVTGGDPHQLTNSLFSDNGTDAQTDSRIFGFGGLTDSFPGLQRNAQNPAKLEAVKAGGGGFQNFVSGAVQMNWGRISSQPITLDFNTTVPQSICEPPDGHSGIVTALLFYDNTTSLVTSDQTMNIGIESGGASYADAVAVTDLGLGNAIKRNYYLLLPAAESQIIPDGKSLQLTLSGLFGGAVEVQCQPFGVIL